MRKGVSAEKTIFINNQLFQNPIISILRIYPIPKILL